MFVLAYCAKFDDNIKLLRIIYQQLISVYASTFIFYDSALHGREFVTVVIKNKLHFDFCCFFHEKSTYFYLNSSCYCHRRAFCICLLWNTQ